MAEETINCTKDIAIGVVPMGFGLRIVSILISIIMAGVLIISLIWWWYALKVEKLVYLRKRGFTSAVLLSVYLVFVLSAGTFTRTTEETNQLFKSCLISNFLLISNVPLALAASLESVFYFRTKAAFTKALLEGKSLGLGFWMRVRLSRHFPTIRATLLLLLCLLSSFWYALSFCPEGFNSKCQFLSASSPEVFIVITGIFFMGAFVVYYIHKKLQTCPDPFDILRSIYHAFRISFYLILLFVPAGIILNYSLFHADDIDEFTFTGSLLIDIPLFYFYLYLVPYQIYRAYQFGSLTEIYQNITLESILDDKIGHDLLKKHLVLEFSVENILFLDEATALDKDSSKESINMLYVKYIEAQVLNLPYEVTSTLTTLYSQNRLNLDSFTPAIEEITETIRNDSFVRFKHSEAFEQYAGFASLDET